MFDLEIIRNAVSNLVASGLNFVPKLLTAILILLVGWIVAKLLRKVVEQFAERIGLNRVIEKTGLGQGLEQAQITQPPAEMLGIFIFWLIFLNFIPMALESLELSAAVAQLQQFIAYLPRLLSALLIFIGGSLVAQFVGQLAQAAVASMGVGFHQAIGQAVRSFLLIFVAIITVQQLGLDVTVLTQVIVNLLTVTAAGLALAFGLGGREAMRNILAGHYAREAFDLGDTVVVGDDTGALEAIGTLNAEIMVGEERLVIPNSRLTESVVKIQNRAA